MFIFLDINTHEMKFAGDPVVRLNTALIGDFVSYRLGGWEEGGVGGEGKRICLFISF